jgi:CubicO group peptidase (beta-lactamase class C family)
MNPWITGFVFMIIVGAEAFATDVIRDDDPGVRSNVYIDDTRDNYASGWKASITNTDPSLLESGVWFDPAPVPRPFAVADAMTPLSAEIRARLRDNSTDGLIVVKNGEIVQQYFRYGFGIDRVHAIHSTGKVFTSFAIQPVYDSIGDAGLDTPLKEYLPRLDGKFFGDGTLRQALDMKNGMEWSENYEDPTSATMVSGPVGGWDPLDPERGPESWYERMFDYPKYGEHGKTWVYSSASVIASSFAAGAIAERPFSELVQFSYNMLGFEDPSWYAANQFNELGSEGGQYMTIRDHAKLGRFMIETQGSAYVDDVWNVVYDPKDPGDAKYLEKYGDFLGSVGYKNYWYKLSADVILALGSSGQLLYVDRTKNLVISKFSSFIQGQGAEEFGEALSIVREIASQF